ncbi:MAG TPA: hypothetical protein DCQ06_10030 [Myxococcales bacterium]|nr:hypothetical protein [Myxococcales bacterium]HAN31922.1 hypothetical protein [Myxococcales bacterium]
MDAQEFWSVKRSTRPRVVMEELLEKIPLRLPNITLQQGVNVHVPGQGQWTVSLKRGRPQVSVGAAHDALGQLVVQRRTFREVVSGAIRDRALEVMLQLGRPRQLPDFSHIKVDLSRLRKCADLDGSIALEIYDKEFDETYRLIWIFGSTTEIDTEVTTTVRVGIDTPVQWIVQGQDPLHLMNSSDVRVEGELSLPVRALRILFQ